jgi:hypothetical protein
MRMRLLLTSLVVVGSAFFGSASFASPFPSTSILLLNQLDKPLDYVATANQKVKKYRRGGNRGSVNRGHVNRGHVNRGHVNRGHVNRPPHVSNRPPVNRNVNRNVNVNRSVHIHARPWGWRPYYGVVVAGVALGTVLAVTSVPAAPAPNLCWYWSDQTKTRGYWDYCPGIKPPPY